MTSVEYLRTETGKKIISVAQRLQLSYAEVVKLLQEQDIPVEPGPTACIISKQVNIVNSAQAKQRRGIKSQLISI